MPGVRGVRFHELFWTLEPHRGQAYYPCLRDKLLWLMRRKEQSTDPVSSRDNYFGAIKALVGIWHFAIMRNPDIVIFYTLNDGCLNLAMVGSHHDYPFNGKNSGASARTGGRVNNTVADGPLQSPNWRGLRWSDPADLLRHPDLPELSAPAMDGLLTDIADEMGTGGFYRARHGVAIEDRPEAEFDRYFACLHDVRQLIFDVQVSRLGGLYWLRRAPEDFSFVQAAARR